MISQCNISLFWGSFFSYLGETKGEKIREKRTEEKQVRIHEANSRVYWAGAVMPENHEKNENFGHFGHF